MFPREFSYTRKSYNRFRAECGLHCLCKKRYDNNSSQIFLMTFCVSMETTLFWLLKVRWLSIRMALGSLLPRSRVSSFHSFAKLVAYFRCRIDCHDTRISKSALFILERHSFADALLVCWLLAKWETLVSVWSYSPSYFGSYNIHSRCLASRPRVPHCKQNSRCPSRGLINLSYYKSCTLNWVFF